MDGGIYQCVSLPQSVCECLQISFGVHTAGSLENALRCLSGGGGLPITDVKTSVFPLASVGAPPPWHAPSQVLGKAARMWTEKSRLL